MKFEVVKGVLGSWFVHIDGEPIAQEFKTNAEAWRWVDRHSTEEINADGRQKDIQERVRRR